MNTYVAFLRGVNMMGRKTIKMAELREVLAKRGFKNVQTYIQSGNIVFGCEEKDSDTVEHMLEQIIEEEFGFDVPVLIESPEELEETLAGMPEYVMGDTPHNRVYALWYKGKIDSEKLAKFEAGDYSPNRYSITDGIIYFASPKGAKKGLYTGDFEKKLGIVGTTRNIKTLERMVEMVKST